MKRREVITKMSVITAGAALIGSSKAMANAMPGSRNLPDDNLNHSISKQVFYASQIGAKLDSNVISGGGTDDTAVIQALLDKAPELGNLHLIMDGAALIRGINIHSNTTIECLNPSCGFFLAPQSNRSLIRNVNQNLKGERKDKNISLFGGTYNQDCKHQLKSNKENLLGGVFGMVFYGVENFTMRDVTIRNQRTWAMHVANWYRVNMENISIDLPDQEDASNQDGIHFWGPGQFLTMRNIQGQTGDDFIALAPDENDKVSSITDVLIDGVFLNNADQGIRLLTREEGRLDRVIIKNITGTYRSFGFYINPWFPNENGNFGNIVFDTIDLRQTKPNYHYTPPFLFRLGGTIESLTLRNIYHHEPLDARSIIEIGWTEADPNDKFALDFKKRELTPNPNDKISEPKIKSLVVDGLHIFETNTSSSEVSYIKVMGQVDNMTIRNAEILKPADMPQKGCLIETNEKAKVNTLLMSGICANKMSSLLSHKDGEIGTVQLNNLLCSEIKDAVISIEKGNIRKLNADGVYGAEVVSNHSSGKVGGKSGTAIKM